MYSAFDHWAYWSHMLTVISMFSPCTQWVFGPLSPVPGAYSSLYRLFGIESGLEKAPTGKFGVNEGLGNPLPMAPGLVVANDRDLLLVGSCIYVCPLTGGKGQYTQWVHCEFIVGSETIRPAHTQQVNSGHFQKVPTHLPSPNPAGK